jgi:hypothetical protein
LTKGGTRIADLATVGKSAEADALRVDVRLLAEPIDDPLMLADDEREQRELQRMRLG